MSTAIIIVAIIAVVIAPPLLLAYALCRAAAGADAAMHDWADCTDRAVSDGAS